MNRFKLLLLSAALVLTAVAARPAKSDACFTYGICETCTSTTKKPCRVVVCGTHRTETCGSCTANCVPPPD